MIKPPTTVWYLTRNPKPRVTPVRINSLSSFLRIHKKNRNSEIEKKNISIVSIIAILLNQTKPGIEASNMLEIRPFLGPYSLLPYSKTIQSERRLKVTATSRAENRFTPSALKNRDVVTSNRGG